jgi:phospholipase/lecithinase/hemolysin
MIHSWPYRHLNKVLLALVLLVSGGVHAGGRVDRIVVFGDSLSDPGNAFVITHRVSLPPYDLIPDAPYARGGLHFTNGPTWIEQLAHQLPGMQGVCPALRAPRLCGNYAVGGARARPGTQFDLTTQVQTYLENHQPSGSDPSLYVVHIGGNDVRDAIEALAVDPTGATSVGIVGDALDAIADNILALTASGARKFLVPNVPNLALAPAVRLQGPQAQAAAQAFSVVYNNALAGVLANLEANLPVTISRLDVFTLLNETVANPAAAGLSEVEATCITPGVIRHAECKHPDRYLFWDGIHPTRAGHAILARRAKQDLLPP